MSEQRAVLNLKTPHKAQAEFLASPHKRIVLNWGRRCLVTGTLVTLADGTSKPIEDILVGDYILSLNTKTGATEPKRVDEVHRFGAMQSPKPLVSLEVYGHVITSTYDHEYYIGDTWVPAIELAWGALAASEREKFQLLCQQYGTVIDDKLQRRLQDIGDETGPRRFWVLADRDGRQDRQGTPGRGGDLASEPAQQTASEPHQQRPDGQSDREPGMGDASRELGAHDDAGTAEPQPRREVGDTPTDRGTGASDTRVSSEASERLEAGDVTLLGREVPRSETGLYQGRLEGKDLAVSAACVRHSQVTYDLTVEDNHNYVAEGILVHNTGKSMGAGIKVAMEAIMHQGTYYIIAPTIGNAQKIYWDEVLKTIFKDSPLVDQDFVKNVMKRKDYKEVGFNQNELSVTIDYIEGAKVQLPNGKWVTINHDTKKPRSKIVLYGATQPDNILGIGLRGVVLDECAKMPNFNYVWRKVVRPMLGDHQGWAVFISTPLGIFNPWYEWVNIAKADPKKYFYSHATGYDNPYFPDEEIEEARADAIAANELHVFEQEWLAEFVNPEGAIFPEFDHDLHTFNLKELPRTGTDILGIDFGFNPDPAAIITARIDEKGDWWIYDEVYGTDMDDDRIATVIKNKQLDTKFERIIGDANAKNSIELLRRVYRIPIVPGPKGSDSIKTGINQVHGMLRKQANGEPRLRIASHLTNTIREFQSYSRKRDAAGVYYNVPEDANNHTIDCIRYMLKLMEAPDKDKDRRTAPVKERKYSKVTGRPL